MILLEEKLFVKHENRFVINIFLEFILTPISTPAFAIFSKNLKIVMPFCAHSRLLCVYPRIARSAWGYYAHYGAGIWSIFLSLE